MWKVLKMGETKVELKRIENPSSRRATFYKRKNGLLKRHSSFLLPEVALIIFSETGKIYEFGSDNYITAILEKYRRCTETTRNSRPLLQNTEFYHSQLKRLHERVELLQKKEKNMVGEDLEQLTLKELQELEKQLRKGFKRICDTKMQMLSQCSKSFIEKVRSLEAENTELLSKLSSRGDSSTSAPELFINPYLSEAHLHLGHPYNAMSTGSCDGNRDAAAFFSQLR